GDLIDRVNYHDNDPWPENADGLGPSLEKTDPLLNGQDQASWRSSILLGGTPGRTNSTDSKAGGYVEPEHDLEINEVFAGAGDGFVEIHNEGAASASLAGMKLVRSAVGTGGYLFPAGTPPLAPHSRWTVPASTLPFPLTDGAQWLGLVTSDLRFVDGLSTRARPAGRA